MYIVHTAIFFKLLYEQPCKLKFTFSLWRRWNGSSSALFQSQDYGVLRFGTRRGGGIISLSEHRCANRAMPGHSLYGTLTTVKHHFSRFHNAFTKYHLKGVSHETFFLYFCMGPDEQDKICSNSVLISSRYSIF